GHRGRVEGAVEARGRGGGWGRGSSTAAVVELHRGRVRRHRGARQLLFNGSVYRSEVATKVRFDEKKLRASDTTWCRELARREKARVEPQREIDFFWLTHDANISNPASRRRGTEDLARIRAELGAAWGDTDARLDQLRAALRGERGSDSRVEVRDAAPPASRTVTDTDPDYRGRVSTQADPSETKHPAVSAMIKITALDVPYAGHTVPHILRQHDYPFRERIVVVDRRREYEGKYARRDGADPRALDALLNQWSREGIVDRIVDVDDAPERRQAILGRYFGESAD